MNLVEELKRDYFRAVNSPSYREYKKYIGTSWGLYSNSFERFLNDLQDNNPISVRDRLAADGAISSAELSQEKLQLAIEWHVKNWYEDFYLNDFRREILRNYDSDKKTLKL